MKEQLLACLMFVFGIGFGYVLAKPSLVHAEMPSLVHPDMKVVRVTKLHLSLDSGALPVAGPVVGFTCSPNDDGTTDCFIASQP